MVFPIEFKPVGSILYIRNRDVPRVVGELGNILGDAGINIASIQLSRAEKGGIAQTVLLLDESPGADVLKKLREKEFIVEARFVKV
jgi:D-3-phosphoglycerate dehydrogenase